MKFVPIRWKHLSDQQAAVLRWVLEDTGSLELLARAGCGKTYTLMQVVDAIIEGRLGAIAIMAYNKSIANELKAKLEKAGYDDWKLAQAGTVHSFGFGVWKKIADKNIKVEGDKMSNIVKSMIESLYVEAGSHYSKSPSMTEHGLTEMEFLEMNQGAVCKLTSLAKQRAVGHLCQVDDKAEWFGIWEHFGLEDDVTEDTEASKVIEYAIKAYKISLSQCRSIIDFDDMILAPLYFKARFLPKDWVLVDESQDTNPARRALALAMLKPKTGRMIFVGDNKQAIYGFTGADSDSMNQLKKATNAKTLPLNVTRRCPKAVVRMAQRLVPDFTAHEDAPEGIVRAMEYGKLALENLSKDDAILCRNTAPLIETAYMLLGKGVACRVEGREIGTGLIKLARRWKLKTLNQLLNKLSDYEARETAKFMSKGQEERIDKLVDQLNCLRIVINTCLTKNKHSIDDLVTDIESMFGNTPEGEQPKVLTLATGHRSKGREWKRVYILDRAKYCPSPFAKKEWQQEQELNLEYVMITRAMFELIDVVS